MKLVTFLAGRDPRPGVIVGEQVHALPEATLLDFIHGGQGALRRAAEVANGSAPSGKYRLADVKLLAPIPRPSKNVFCVGRNYKLHIEEGARARGVQVKFPPVPEFFSKPPTTVVGPGADVRLPMVTQRLDYEVELAIVIGRTCRDIAASDAREHILGYTVVNDITARDLQADHGQWFKGKGLDTSCPMGPWIVTAEEFDIGKGHRIWLTVNGQIRQDSSTADMLFDCYQIVESLSQGMTLEPGDVIATGTPSGVGLGMNPQVWLKDRDVVEAGIDGIGSLVNTIRAI
jgi:2-keto-4-pentenoate hydratase/2-oxohepta-3-ene-1,7-dioic acid hydratase in catechol pathway